MYDDKVLSLDFLLFGIKNAMSGNGFGSHF